MREHIYMLLSLFIQRLKKNKPGELSRHRLKKRPMQILSDSKKWFIIRCIFVNLSRFYRPSFFLECMRSSYRYKKKEFSVSLLLAHPEYEKRKSIISRFLYYMIRRKKIEFIKIARQYGKVRNNF
jgi:hypothetical protein